MSKIFTFPDAEGEGELRRTVEHLALPIQTRRIVFRSAVVYTVRSPCPAQSRDIKEREELCSMVRPELTYTV